MRKKRIAILASGRGSNAAAIIDYSLKLESSFEVVLIVSNRKHAGVFDLAEEHKLASIYIRKNQFYKTEQFLLDLEEHSIDMIVLAGFLWLIPTYLVAAYPQKILNIHPTLLPKYGGKGMYGSHVHEAVHKANETVSGMTIHYVDEAYDEGSIIFQAQCQLAPNIDPPSIGRRVLALEHEFYPRVINGVASRLT